MYAGRSGDSGGYREVIDLCDDLADLRRGAEMRAWLTCDLNYQLQISAVGNATQLAVGDLRAMVADLRRALRRAKANSWPFLSKTSPPSPALTRV